MERPHLRILPESIRSRGTDFDGGGSSYERSDYYSHGQSLIRDVRYISQHLKTTNDCVKDRAFIEIHLASGEKLKERYANLLNNSRIVISDLINESTGFGYIKADDIVLLESRLKDYAETEEHRGKSYFSFVEELRTVDYLLKLSPSLRSAIEENPEQNIEITIESFSNLPKEVLEKGILHQLKTSVQEQNGKINSYYIHSNNSIVVEAEVPAYIAMTLASHYDSIRSIEPTPRIVMPTTDSFGINVQNLSIAPINGDAKVCVFDSGTVTNNHFFDPFIINRINAINAHSYDTRHGNFVASRVIYRDNIENQLATGQLTPFVKVLDVRVFGIDNQGRSVALSENQLMNVISQTVHNHHKEIRVYNLSLGFMDPQTDETYLSDVMVSRIAAELDALSKRYDVLFVISAGNIRSLYHKLMTMPYPEHFSDDGTRITPPAESFLGLSVGSIVTQDYLGALGMAGHPSAYSRRGPGFGGVRKPDIVCDGGNVTISGSLDRRIAASALGRNLGDVEYDCGTSFSAPLISSYAAELFDKIPDATSNLVKGLLIHFSDHPQGASSFQRDAYEHIGFGVPDFNLCLESLKSKATYVYEGAIPQQTYINIPFWVPSILASSTNRPGRKKAKVRVTLVWNPLTDRRKQTDYSLIHLYPNLFKVNEQGLETQVPLSSSSLTNSSYKQKFYPVMRIEKEFERNFAGGLWNLQLRMSSRWDVPDEYEQDFAVIISVEDPHNKLDVYGEIMSEVGAKFEPLLTIGI
jgi:hypothetical protein